MSAQKPEQKPTNDQASLRVLKGSNKKVIQVPVSEIKIPVYVRKQADDDRVLFFAELYNAKADIPPIQITVDNRLVDGRHRLLAQELNDQTHVECEIVESYSTLEFRRSKTSNTSRL
jgi:hypothetical protein